MKRIILFRFHKFFDVCKNHVEILKKFNPGIEIYGLFGGEAKDYAKAKKIGIKNVFMVPFEDRVWKWLNGDFCLRWWYKDRGYKIKFDMLHLIEWDMILLESINEYFKHIKEGVGITDKQPMSEIYDKWTWVAPSRGRWEWLHLKKQISKKYNCNKKPLAGIFGGVCMSRKFIEKYSKEKILGLCNDEVRVLLYAQAYRMKISNTNLKNPYYNADNKKTVTPDRFYELAKKGFKAFHPIRGKLNLKEINKLIKTKTT